jgi:hypothetical protein
VGGGGIAEEGENEALIFRFHLSDSEQLCRLVSLSVVLVFRDIRKRHGHGFPIWKSVCRVHFGITQFGKVIEDPKSGSDAAPTQTFHDVPSTL